MVPMALPPALRLTAHRTLCHSAKGAHSRSERRKLRALPSCPWLSRMAPPPGELASPPGSTEGAPADPHRPEPPGSAHLPLRGGIRSERAGDGGPGERQCREKDSNLRRQSPADLQSAPFGRSGIPAGIERCEVSRRRVGVIPRTHTGSSPWRRKRTSSSATSWSLDFGSSRFMRVLAAAMTSSRRKSPARSGGMDRSSPCATPVV